MALLLEIPLIGKQAVLVSAKAFEDNKQKADDIKDDQFPKN